MHFLIAAGIRKTTMADAYWNPKVHQDERLKMKCPSQRTWLAAAQQEALESNVSFRCIVSGNRERRFVAARWRAWKRVLDSDPKYTVNGLARTSGFDHTTIMSAMKRLAAKSPSKPVDNSVVAHC